MIKETHSTWWHKEPFYRFFNLVGVRGKIMGIAVLLVLLLASLLIWQAQDTFTVVLREQMAKQGVSLGQYLAVRSENSLLINNIYALHELIQDTMNNHEELVYVIIADTQDRVVIDSFGEGIPKGLLSLNRAPEGKEYARKTFTTQQGVVQDIAIPIMQGRLGQVRLGLSEAGIAAVIRRLQGLLWLGTFLISLLGVGVAYLLATLINKPLKELVAATRKIGSGQLEYRVPLDWARDELGQLGMAFNEMAASLEKAQGERKRLWQEVLHKEEMRRYLLNKVISAQEDERYRISRELHDETGQALCSVNLALASLDNDHEPSDFRRRVKLMQETVTKAMDDIHDLARQLRPSVLDKLGLAAAVERFVRDCSLRWGTDIGFSTIGCDSGDIPVETKIAAYRIIQEALTNALRHAQANNISVVLQKTRDRILAVVEDDGIGFDLQETENNEASDSHLGLFGMQERAEMLGGKITIETSLGNGTTIYVELPLEGE